MTLPTEDGLSLAAFDSVVQRTRESLRALVPKLMRAGFSAQQIHVALSESLERLCAVGDDLASRNRFLQVRYCR